MKPFLQFKILISFITSCFLSAFAQESIEDTDIVVDELPTIQPQLPEMPNVADTLDAQLPQGALEQYGGYFIVAVSAILLLLLFVFLYFLIVKKSKANFMPSGSSGNVQKQQLVNVQDNLYSEDTLPGAIKSFLIKTNFLP